MGDDVYVSCHAPCLSLILYETILDSCNQVGLLIGQICNEVTSRATDANEIHEEHKSVIYLEYCVPVVQEQVFNSSGQLKKDAIQNLCNIYPDKIIGWYSFRNNCKQNTVSMKDLLIHKEFLEALPEVKPSHFVLALLNSSTAPSGSTHTFNHVFMRYLPRQKQFDPVTFKIYTLSDKALDASGYSMNTTLPTSGQFDKIVNSEKKEQNAVQYVLNVYKMVNATFSNFHKKLLELSSTKILLEDEILALKCSLGEDVKPDITVAKGRDAERPLFEQRCIKFDPQLKHTSNMSLLLLDDGKQKAKAELDEKSRRNSGASASPSNAADSKDYFTSKNSQSQTEEPQCKPLLYSSIVGGGAKSSSSSTESKHRLASLQGTQQLEGIGENLNSMEI